MKLIITNLYTLFILVVCDAIVLLSVKWAITIDVLYIVLLMIGTLPFMVVSTLFDKSITFFPYYFIRLRQVDVYSSFFLYMLGFIFGTFYLWHTFWQHDGHWILGCIFGTILNWILVAMKGNDLVLVHKRIGFISEDISSFEQRQIERYEQKAFQYKVTWGIKRYWGESAKHYVERCDKLNRKRFRHLSKEND